MGTAPPEGCTSYEGVRADPVLAQRCSEWYGAQEPDWTMVYEVPWAKIAMEVVAFLLL